MSRLPLVLLLLLVLSVLTSTCQCATNKARFRARFNAASQSPAIDPLDHPFDRFPHMSMYDFYVEGKFPGDDPLSQVRSLIGTDEEIAANASTMPAAEDATPSSDDNSVSFVETGTEVGKVRSFCEICILVMQMKERGQPHLCAGLNTNYHITCIEVLESLLRADKAVVYWLKNGCMHMDSEGPEIVRPCPAINICSWVPNLFVDAPSLVRDGVDSLCPKDPKFLPTIPQEFRNLLGSTDNTLDFAKDGPVDPETKGL